MRVITLAGSPRFPSRSSALLEYAREQLTSLDIEVCHWNLHNFEPENLLYARFDSPALKTLVEQLKGADGLIVATPVYKASFSGALKTLLNLLPSELWKGKWFYRWQPAAPLPTCLRLIMPSNRYSMRSRPRRSSTVFSLMIPRLSIINTNPSSLPIFIYASMPRWRHSGRRFTAGTLRFLLLVI